MHVVGSARECLAPPTCTPPRPHAPPELHPPSLQAWAPGELQQQVAAGAWWCAAGCRALALKQCLQLPVPLWLEVLCLMGGEQAEAARAEYQGEDLD